jgi:hypothetical protein
MIRISQSVVGGSSAHSRPGPVFLYSANRKTQFTRQELNDTLGTKAALAATRAGPSPAFHAVYSFRAGIPTDAVDYLTLRDAAAPASDSAVSGILPDTLSPGVLRQLFQTQRRGINWIECAIQL